MLAVASCPMFKRAPLDLADELRGLRPLPQASIAVPLRAADPPTLARQSVRLPDHQNGELGLVARGCIVIDIGEHLAQLAHLGPAETVAEQLQHLGIADWLASARGGDEDRPHFGRVGEQPRFPHCGCWAKSTGVSSKTSSFDVLCGHGMTSRHLKGPMR